MKQVNSMAGIIGIIIGIIAGAVGMLIAMIIFDETKNGK